MASADPIVCPRCRGERVIACPSCKGEGAVAGPLGPAACRRCDVELHVVACPRCHGEGRVASEEAVAC